MLARGESIAGGLGKKLDVIAAMKTESITTRQISRIVLLTQLTEEELRSVVRNAPWPRPTTGRLTAKFGGEEGPSAVDGEAPVRRRKLA